MPNISVLGCSAAATIVHISLVKLAHAIGGAGNIN